MFNIQLELIWHQKKGNMILSDRSYRHNQLFSQLGHNERSFFDRFPYRFLLLSKFIYYLFLERQPIPDCAKFSQLKIVKDCDGILSCIHKDEYKNIVDKTFNETKNQLIRKFVITNKVIDKSTSLI